MSRITKVWEFANVLPLPEESPLNSCCQFRPISSTNVIMSLLERSEYKTELRHIMRNFIDSD